MRNESHTLISTLLGVVNQWRRREGWSRETVVQHIVEAHERIQGEPGNRHRLRPANARYN